VVNYYGCWGPDKQGRLWIMMEFCDGGSLNDLLEPHGPNRETLWLTESQISVISSSMLRALLYLHTQKIVHRDIKSACRRACSRCPCAHTRARQAATCS
jgi:serine/threonine protein kinase